MIKQITLSIIVVLLVALSPLTAARHKTSNLAPGQAEFQTEEVIIRVNINSSIYTYKVTNLGMSPIVSFSILQHASYNFNAPDGWEKQVLAGQFRAWTNNSQMAIQPKETAEFSMRVSSKGAVLGKAPAIIQFQSGQTATVPGVWVPTHEPRSYIVLIAFVVLLIIILHTSVLARRNRQKKDP
jgi:hypothetical protein